MTDTIAELERLLAVIDTPLTGDDQNCRIIMLKRKDAQRKISELGPDIIAAYRDMEQRNKAMVDALEPFAAIADIIEASFPKSPDTLALWARESNVESARRSITLGHVRRARAARDLSRTVRMCAR